MSMMNSLAFISIIQVISLHEAYDFSCPFQAHWRLRAISMCASERNYSCLYDVNLQVNIYREKCIRSRIVGPGFKYVFQPNPNRDSCDLSRYQPFIFNTTGYSNCAFLKSRCSSEGQITYSDGTTRSDRTCSCQTGKGYTFVKDPINGCFCSSSSSDCSCVVRSDPNNNTLSVGWKDFRCRNEKDISQGHSSGDTYNLSQAVKNSPFNNYKYNLANLPTNEYRTKAVVHVLIVFLSYPLVVIGLYILQRFILHRFRVYDDNRNDKNTKPSGEFVPQTALPEVINRLQESDRIRYNELMQSSKTEKRYFARIMIVGKESVGKTSLLRRLLKDDTAGVSSTDGVDIVVNRCKINIEDGKWTTGKDIPDDKIQTIQRAMLHGTMTDETLDTNLKNIDSSPQHKQDIMGNETEERADNNYVSIKTTTSPDLKPSTLMIDTSNTNVAEETDIGPLSNMSAYTNDSKGNIAKLDDIHKMENNSGDQLVRFLNSKSDSKENEDVNKQVSLLMPLDLMSRVFSKTSTSDVPTDLEALCGLWDFAGQKEFYATHQAFLTKSAVYLVVADITDDIFKQGVEQHSTDFQHVGDYVDFWFDTIHCHQTVNTAKNKQHSLVQPPVILVFTGKDKLKKEIIEKKEDKIRVQLGELLKCQSKFKHLRNIFFLSNTNDSEEKFDELRQAISEAAKEMHNWGELMPLKWILLEHLIEINKENGKKITTLFEMLKIAEHPEINISRKEDMLLFLRVQHEIGNIIFFEDIQDLIILNPQWLVDAFRCLASNTYNDKPQQLKEWTQFVQYGELSDMLITELFKSKCGGLFSEHREDLLKVMEKFDILVENEDTGFFIMPSKMPFSTFEVVYDKLGVLNCKRTSWLCLKFEFLPPAFFNHLSVWFIKKYKPSKVQNEGQQNAFYRGICIFDINSSGCEKLLVAMSTDTIALQILSFSTVEKELGSTCSTIYKEIITKVKAIIQRYNLTIKFDLCFKCNEGDFHKDAAPYKDLQKNREFYCLQHQQAHKSEEVYLPWMKNVFEDDQTITETERDVPILGIGNKLAVVALDLGTTNSGYAYSFRSDFESNPLKISTNDWSAEGVHSTEMKAPSLLLLNPDQSFNSFGYRAQHTYSDLLDDDPDKAAKYYFVQNFKMQLHNSEISLGMMILDVTGKELPAIKVFTESIRFLKDHCFEMFTGKKLEFTMKLNDVFFVITVPAIWRHAAKQFMRVASEKAGIKSSQMMLAYEPDVAALFCSLLPEDQGIAKYFQERRKLMIVDLGGGTADITVVKVIKREEKLTYIEHVYRVTGGAWGGNQVNKNFEKFLELVFGNDVMDEFKRDYLSEYLELMSEFEVQKKGFPHSGKKTGVGIRFSGYLCHIFKSKRGKNIKDELQGKVKGMLQITGDKLRIDLAIFKRFFQDCVQEIVNHINESFLKRGCAWPSAMILVGGFSDAPIIREAIVDAFPFIKDIVSPVATSLAVLKGSVIFGHEPAIVTGRVCRETLGLTLRRAYVPEGQTEKKTFKIDGQLRADKSFQKMFSINEIIKLGQTSTVAIQDIHTNKELRKHPKIIEVYASQDEDPKYITDAGCSLRGKITVNPPNGKWPENAEGFIDMETGGTEIIVRYRDKHSGQITEEAIDFM